MYFEVTELTAGEVERGFIQKDLGMTLNQLLLNLPMEIQRKCISTNVLEG